MPNHISTNLRLTGNAKSIKRLITKATENNTINFSRLAPMPKALEGITSPVRLVSEEEAKAQRAAYKAYLKGDRKYSAPAVGITEKESAKLIKLYGADNWYDWCNQNWGTKWGTYEVTKKDDNSFSYMTAWSPATQLWLTASKDFPEVVIYHEYADECGEFVGSQTIQNGEIIESEDVEWNSSRGIEIREAVGMSVEEEEEEEVK